MTAPLAPHNAPIEPPGSFEGLRPRAILSGLAIDWLLSVVAILTLALLLGGGGELSDDAFDELLTSSTGLWITMPLLLGCTAIGGFVAGRAAPGHERLNAVAMAIAEIAISLLGYLVPVQGAAAPLWVDALGIALAVPAAWLGGTLASALRAAQR